MRKIVLLLPIVTLAACATGPSLQSRMAAYTGASTQELVSQLGVPDKQITAGGVQYLAYEHHRFITADGDDGFIGFGGFGGGFGGGYGGGFGGPFFGPAFYGAGIPPSVTEVSCETTFMLKDDKVFNFTLRGDDCG